MAPAYRQPDRLLPSTRECGATVSDLQDVRLQLCRPDQSAQVCIAGIDGIEWMCRLVAFKVYWSWVDADRVL